MPKVCLIVIDGFGISEDSENPTNEAKFINNLKLKFPSFELFAHGSHVGLSKNTMGNSEAGHMTIGAGRVVLQGIELVNNYIKNGKLEEKIKSIIDKTSDRIHLIGLLSDGCVHSSVDHCKILNQIFKKLDSNKNIFIHAIADGRDTIPKDFLRFYKEFNNIVSISGRYYTMDRDNNTDRIEKAYEMMTNGFLNKNWIENYKECISDEFFEPTLIKNEKILENDTLIFFNTRADRMIQIVKRFQKSHKKIYTLMDYKKVNCEYFFKTEKIKNTLAEVISDSNLSQMHIAETEKYAHVTYFFNGLQNKQFFKEDRILVPSKKVTNFDQKPECSMVEVAEETIKSIDKKYNFILVNLAGADLVGHTGNYNAVIISVKTINKVIEKIYKKCIENNYILAITADHGNCEQMIENGKICKKHTKNKVIFIIANNQFKKLEIKEMSLANVAPTILSILKIKKPKEMNKSILK